MRRIIAAALIAAGVSACGAGHHPASSQQAACTAAFQVADRTNNPSDAEMQAEVAACTVNQYAAAIHAKYAATTSKPAARMQAYEAQAVLCMDYHGRLCDK